MKNFFAILLTSILLSGCAGWPDNSLLGPKTSASVVGPVSVQPAATVKEPASIVIPLGSSETAELIRTLDNAGCDFAAVQRTTSTARKGSATLAIACK